MKKVVLAFCGAGHMGQAAHLRNYAQLGAECEVLAVSDVVPGKAANVAARYGVPHAYESHAELLARHGADVDAVVAIGGFDRHGAVLPAIIGTGKPFLIEKPLASGVAVGRRLLQAIEEHRSRCMVAYHKRSDPAIAWAKAEIDRLKGTGELGALRYVKVLMPPGDWVAGAFGDVIHADAPFPAIPADPNEPGYDDARQRDYVRFVNYYIHQVNLLRHFLGEPYTFDYVSPSAILAAGRSASGVTCLLEMGSHDETVGWGEEATAFFERGYVKVELPAPMALNRAGRVTVLRDPGAGRTPVAECPAMPWEHAMMRQAKNFLKFVRGEAPAPSDAAEALRDLEQAKEFLRLWKGAN